MSKTGISVSASERFWSKVDMRGEDECWPWEAYVNDGGYGTFSLTWRESPKRAHRVAYELLIGPIPDGLVLDHLCRNRRCVNPGHLEPVTHAENNRRGISTEARRRRNAEQTHCKRGHEFTPENTYRPPVGYRVCRTCRRDRARGYMKEYRQRLAGA